MTERNDNLTQIELEVQRRVTDALASAGVPNGRISLEVLFMLPPRFTREYVKLFDAALQESIRGAGYSSEGKRSVRRTGALRDSGKGASRNADGSIKADNRRAVIQVGAGGGKRWHRKHWLIRDEDAMRIKANLDRKLIRLSGAALRELEAAKRETLKGMGRTADLNGGLSIEEIEDMGKMPDGSDDEVTYTCTTCGMDHTALVRLLGRMRDRGDDKARLDHCPNCGADQG